MRALTIIPVIALVLSACGSGGTPSQQRLSGGIATWAEQPNTKVNYIFPLTSGGFFSVANISQFQYLMYRPLYWFGTAGKVQLNSSLSVANDPVYGADGKTVTIKLKNWNWSDGTPITSRDVEFWMNLLKANRGSYGAYVPGGFPDNVISMSFPDAQTSVFTLDKQYSTYFYTYNELSQISPLPQHVWDKTSDSSAVGDYDRTPKNAVAVYKYIDGQSRSIGTYNNNPLWQVVDGPWKLKSIDTSSNVSMVPNPAYSGPVKPTLAEFREQAFTQDTAEFNVLRSSGVDYGYIPVQDAAQRGALSKYTFAPWTGWQITYFQINFNNTDHGAIYKQLYFRQAMQHLVDQTGYINNIFKGFAYPDYGPVPSRPANNFIDAFSQTNPYPFDVAAATKLLKDNGWTVNAGGVSTCSNPGTGTGQCGAGIASGAKASFKMMYASGLVYVQQEMEALKSDLSKVGIDVTITQAPFDTVIGDAFAGSTSADIDNWGAGWIFSPDYYPTGDEIFSTGAISNGGAYSNATNDSNTTTTTTSSDYKSLYPYQDFLAKDLPVIWLPVTYAQLTMARSTLHGWDPQDPLENLNPENWYFTAS